MSKLPASNAQAARTGLRLMALHAHPDDESSKGAATYARYAAEGHPVLIATCTGGERGSILNPAMDRAEYRDHIPDVRIAEMAAAAEILGVQHKWLGFIDSGLPEGDPRPPVPNGSFSVIPVEEAVVPVVETIRQFRPHVLITYDENGGYPHPDHIQNHIVSVRAWDLAADPNYRSELGAPWEIKKMYYTHGFVRKRLETIHQDYLDRGMPSPLVEALNFWKKEGGDTFDRVTTQVTVGDYFDRRDDALLAHATQIDPNGPFFAVPQSVQRRLWPTEEFELARSRVPVTLPETDLFAGIDSESE